MFKTKELYRDSEGIYDDGMVETRSEHADRKWAEVAIATLDGLTGTFGGVIGYAISSYLTTDPEVIAASTQFGDTAFTVVGIVADVDPVTGAKKEGKQPTKKKPRKGGKGRKKGKKGKASSPGSARRRKKPTSLPSWKNIKIDMDHIVSGHTKGGDRERVSGKKSVFPENMPPEQIERLVREAYRYGKRIKTQEAEETRVKVQGEADGILIEMYVNLDTKTIVTAYPTTEDRR